MSLWRAVSRNFFSLQRGVQVGNDVQVNTVNESYVLWQWLVGEAATTTTINASSTTPTNSIASTVAAADAGHFSVVGYQGNSTNGATVAHSLGGEPELIFFRGREGSGASSFLSTILKNKSETSISLCLRNLINALYKTPLFVIHNVKPISRNCT